MRDVGGESGNWWLVFRRLLRSIVVTVEELLAVATTGKILGRQSSGVPGPFGSAMRQGWVSILVDDLTN